jgi:hypothetical protein
MARKARKTRIATLDEKLKAAGSALHVPAFAP